MRRLLAWIVVGAPFLIPLAWVIYIEIAWGLAGWPGNGWPAVPAIITTVFLLAFLVVVLIAVGPEVWDWAWREINKEPEPKKEDWP